MQEMESFYALSTLEFEDSNLIFAVKITSHTSVPSQSLWSAIEENSKAVFSFLYPSKSWILLSL